VPFTYSVAEIGTLNISPEVRQKLARVESTAKCTAGRRFLKMSIKNERVLGDQDIVLS
jgi:hypothetical protein